MTLIDGEKVNRLLGAGPRIVVAPMVLDKGVKVIRIRILIAAQKQGVFKQMSKTWPLIWILITTGVDRNRHRGRVTLGIGDQNRTNTVVQYRVAVFTLVIRALDNGVIGAIGGFSSRN